MVLRAVREAAGEEERGRAQGLFVWLRLLLPYLTHPDRQAKRKSKPALRARQLQVARGLGTRAALAHGEEGALEDEYYQAARQEQQGLSTQLRRLLQRGGKRQLGPDRQHEAQQLVRWVRSNDQLRREHEEEEKGEEEEDFWALLDASGRLLKRSASWNAGDQ